MDKITIMEIAKDMNVSRSCVSKTVSIIFPTKTKMGVTTYLSSEEAAVIAERLKHNQYFSKNYTAPLCAYFAYVAQQNAVKIGVSRNVDRRISFLQTGNCYEIKKIGVVPVKGFEDEKKIHLKFKALYIRGEWFRYDISIVNYIKSYGTYFY